MAMSLFLLVMIIVGGVVALRLKGPARASILRGYAIGVVLSLGGCVGALRALGAETSGRPWLFDEVNPYLWVGIFLIGVFVTFAQAVRALRARREENRP